MKAIVNAKVVLPDTVIKDGVILFEGDKILAAGKVRVPEGASIIDANGLYAGPGLVDEHCHGYKQYGERIKSDEDTVAMAAGHLKHGTTTITPTAGYGLTRDEFKSVILQCNAAIEAGNTSIRGIHFEGPFINPKHGAHSERAWKFSVEALEEIFSLAGKNVKHMTYAPELECGPEIEKFAADKSVMLDIGHTMASPEDVERAFACGARIVTHLFDAMSGGERKTGDVQNTVAQVALGIEGYHYELICDSLGAHVTPYSMRFAYRCAGEDYINLVTDSTAHKDSDARAAVFAGVPADDINFNDLGQLSGSRLTLNRACRNFMKATGAGIRVAFKCASTNPAKSVGLFDEVGSLEKGKRADILLVDEDFNIKDIYFGGEKLDEIRN